MHPDLAGNTPNGASDRLLKKKKHRASKTDGGNASARELGLSSNVVEVEDSVNGLIARVSFPPPPPSLPTQKVSPFGTLES